MEEKEKETIESEDGKNDSKSAIYFLIAVLLIAAAVAGIILLNKYYKPGQKNEIVRYNGFEFVKKDSLWFTQVQVGGQLYNVPLHYNPYEVEDIPIAGDVDERFQQDRVYITHDPAEKDLGYVAVTAAELSLSMATVFNVEPVAACTTNFTEICATRRIVTCGSNDSAVIYIKELKETNFTMVELKGNCVVIQGKGPELIRAADKFIYVWYRVIK